jgi:hypothetical protein
MPKIRKWLKKRHYQPTFAIKTQAASAPPAMAGVQFDEIESQQTLVPYDENLLERSRTQWQFGDWASLAALPRDTLQHHPDRAKLALLCAAGHQALGNASEARQHTRLALDWGCGKKLVSQILISGVYNTLGRAAAVSSQENRAIRYFQTSMATGAAGSDVRLLTQARVSQQLTQLGLTTNATFSKIGFEDLSTSAPLQLPPLSKGLEEIGETLAQQKADLDAQLKKNADELIHVRKSLDSTVKKEISNATKQIEASIGLQNYFATGNLPNINTERHAWPVSPDFALYLIELIEFNDYDLIIEFGSGISTVIVAKTIANMAKRRQGKPPVELISFDHLNQYYQQTLAKLKHEGLDGAVQLHHAPLYDYTAPNGKVYPYYACLDILVEAAQRCTVSGLRVLVIVDGPPGITGPHARYPAGPIIFSLFKGAQIDLLLDDYIRDEEKQIAKIWREELNVAKKSFTVTERKLEKDACLISISTLQS